MLDLWIKYGQRKKEDPNWEPEYAEEDNSPFAVFSRIVGTYAIWIVGGLLVKDLVTGYFNKQNGGGEEIAVAANTIVDAIHQFSSTLSAWFDNYSVVRSITMELFVMLYFCGVLGMWNPIVTAFVL